MAQEIMPGRIDFVVVEAVPPNRSPYGQFPANRENNWEFFDSGPFRRKLAAKTRALSINYEQIP
jgi:hypothetical protein